jgi:ribonuclease PH
MNVVMNDAKGFIEVQGTAEGHALQRSELAAVGIERLLAAQAAVLAK